MQAFEKEWELYGPIKTFLEEQGYLVHGEVKDCDVVGIRGEEVVVVELKKAFNLKLVMQAIKRQEVCSSVYMAFGVTKATAGRKRLNEIKALAKRLHLGLMIVHNRPSGALVEVPLVPNFDQFRLNVKAQKAFAKELFARETSVNTGGISKKKVITAHKEKALMVAAYLRLFGPQSVATLKAYTADAYVGSLLNYNHYGWYERQSRGVYAFNPQMEEEFLNLGELSAFYTQKATQYSQQLEGLK